MHLTFRRSRPPTAAAELRSLVPSYSRFMQAAIYSSASHVSKAFQAFWASSACQPSTTSYHSCSAAPLSWPSAFSWAAPFFKAGRSLLAFGSNSAVKRTASPPLTLAVSHYRGSILADQLQKSRRQVLVRLESILGNACYNANIQNYGPGGIREAEGRSFRYPLTLRLSDGSKQKVSSGTIPDSVSDDALRSGYYAFGANQLDVISALDRMLKYLEQHHDLVIANGG